MLLAPGNYGVPLGSEFSIHFLGFRTQNLHNKNRLLVSWKTFLGDSSMIELFHNILDTHNDDDMPPEAIFFRNLCARMRFCNGNPIVSVCKIKKNRLRRALECYDHSWTNYLLTKKRCPHLFMDQISVARSRARFTPRKKSISDNLSTNWRNHDSGRSCKG